MSQYTQISQQGQKLITATRRANEPFFLPIADYALDTDTLTRLAGKRKQPKPDCRKYATRFESFAGGKLVLSTREEEETYTMTLLIEPNGVMVSCSCARRVTTICHHLYRYLHTASLFGREDGFGEYRPGGLVETALAHPQQFTISTHPLYGITVKLVNGLGWVYQMEKESQPLSPYLQLPLSKGKQTQSEVTMCYFLMMSPKEQGAPFILPSAGLLAKDGKTVKRFSHYLPGLDTQRYSSLLSEESLRLRACEAILTAGEALAGIAGIEEPDTVDKLTTLFNLYQDYLPRFTGSPLYLHHYYGKKHTGKKPNKDCAFPVQVRTGKVTLQFRLHRTKGVYELRLRFLIDRKRVLGYSPVASFFLGDGDWKVIYLFSSLRDAGIAYWMEKNKWVVTVFEEHFALFEAEVLTEIERHYTVRRTGRRKLPSKALEIKEPIKSNEEISF